jgi:hypothetical protein
MLSNEFGARNREIAVLALAIAPSLKPRVFFAFLEQLAQTVNNGADVM